MKTIRIDITDRQSLNNAIAELNSVKQEWQRKANLCCETIASMLADMISDNLTSIPYSDDLKDISTHTPIPGFPIIGAYASGNTVYIKGEEVAFVEFGAGIYHNQGRSNPLADKVRFDTTPGSYGQGHGNQKYWFVAHNLISCGTPAYMPIYNAIEQIKYEIPTIVRSIFV